MNKQEFLLRLSKGLSGLPQEDIEERLAFYDEIIDDRIEDGVEEEDAVSDIGDVDAVIAQIIEDVSITRLVKQKINANKKLTVWAIILLVLGSPIWLSLAVALLAVVISVYASVWSGIIALWSVFAALLGCSLGGIAGGAWVAVSGNMLTGVALAGAGLACGGLTVFSFYGCMAATKGILILTKTIVLHIKRRLIKKEEA